MKRKVFLAAALFLALGTMGLLSQQAVSQGPNGAVMTGVWSWRNFLPTWPPYIPAGSTLPSLLRFDNDGTTLCSDALAFGGFPLNTYNYTPFYGVWERIGPHEFTATWLSLRFKSDGMLFGFVRAQAKFSFSTDFDHIAGFIYLEYLDSAMGPLMVPDPLAPDAIWVPSSMGAMPIEAARVSVVPY